MKFLLLVAHGSRRESSNAEIRQLTRQLAKIAGTQFAGVRHAFLEIASPTIATGIDACIEAGAREITVLPYFLAAGRHVQEDIPAIVAGKQAEYPDRTIRIAPYLGTAPELPALLLELATSIDTAPK